MGNLRSSLFPEWRKIPNMDRIRETPWHRRNLRICPFAYRPRKYWMYKRMLMVAHLNSPAAYGDKLGLMAGIVCEKMINALIQALKFGAIVDGFEETLCCFELDTDLLLHFPLDIPEILDARNLVVQLDLATSELDAIESLISRSEYQLRKRFTQHAVRFYELMSRSAATEEQVEELQAACRLTGSEIIRVSDLDRSLKESAQEIFLKFTDMKTMEAFYHPVADLECKMQTVVEHALRIYDEKMTSLLKFSHQLDLEMLDMLHKLVVHRVGVKARKIFENLEHFLSDVMVGYNSGNRLLDQVKVHINLKFTQATSDHAEMMRNFRINILKQVKKLMWAFSPSIDSATSSKIVSIPPGVTEDALRKNAEAKFMNYLNDKSFSAKFAEELRTTLDAWIHHVEEMKSTLCSSQVLELNEMEERKLFAEEMGVEIALLVVKNNYEEEIGTRFRPHVWLDEVELKHAHEESLQMALQASTEVTTHLTDNQLNLLRFTSLRLLKRYEYENQCQKPKSEIAVGIDLGTCYCSVNVFREGSVHVVPYNNMDQENRLPTYITMPPAGYQERIFIGDMARVFADIYPGDAVYNVKRIIGRSFDDPLVQEAISRVPFSVVNCENEPRIFFLGDLRKSEEMTAGLLSKLVSWAGRELKSPVKKAVITIPQNFNKYQREATEIATQLAGLEATLLSEAMAIAVAYKLHVCPAWKKNILIFDFGAGALKVTIFRVSKGELRVVGSGSDDRLGGETIDNNMVALIAHKLKEAKGVNLFKRINSTKLSSRRRALGKLAQVRRECEIVKRLCSKPKSGFGIAVHKRDFRTCLDFSASATPEEFHDITCDIFENCIRLVDSTLRDAKLSKAEIHDVILAGGCSGMSKIQELLFSYFEGKTLINSIDPTQVAAIGAAYEAAFRFSSE